MPTSPALNSAIRATDRPLADPTHDSFQRAAFAQRIAETLVARASPDSIVVGLYGKWGEGKSTVLNFIRRSLSEAADKVAVLNFNPWRFPDEAQLLLSFFGELAQIIDKQLYTKGERATKILTSYVAPLIPSVGLGPATADLSKPIGEVFSKLLPDVDKLRTRLEELITESGKRVVVIIDDIDRLEKTQIQTIFRLVKLTADFKHTAYLLAFDDLMVARAIGEVFAASAESEGEGRSLQAGLSFLEKIIQVPLRLPRARTDALLKFCFERVDEAIGAAGLALTDEEAQRLGNTLGAALLPRLHTPRLAVRYANALSFSLPLVRGEVNPVDFILTEAMSVFYPDLYKFVASHEGRLTGSVRESSRVIFPAQDHSKDEKEFIESGLTSYQQTDERTAARGLLCALFPRIGKLFSGWQLFGTSYSTLTAEELTLAQRIAAPTHFGRYFAYTVLLGDVPDEEIATFLLLDAAEQLAVAEQLVSRLGVSDLLQKISARISTLTSGQADAMWQTLIALSPSFSTARRGGMFFSRSEVTQASWLLMQMLGKKPEAQRLATITQLVEQQGAFALAEEITDILGGRSELALKKIREGYAEDEDRLFTEAEWSDISADLAAALVRRALREAGDTPLYLAYPEVGCTLMHRYWQRASGLPPMRDYVLPYLRAAPQDIYQLLEACSPHVSVNHGPLFRASLTADTVSMLADSLGPELYTIARQVFGPSAVEKYPGSERDSHPPTPEERLQQFIYLYEKRDATPSAEVVEE
jgi:hypothetical protein